MTLPDDERFVLVFDSFYEFVGRYYRGEWRRLDGITAVTNILSWKEIENDK